MKVINGIILVCLILCLGAGFFYYRRNAAVICYLEEAMKCKLPYESASFHYDRPTEFCFVGTFRIKREMLKSFCEEAKLAPKRDYTALSTWGQYTAMFSDPVKSNEWLGVYGAVEGKCGWEIAFDPTREQFYFFYGRSIK